MDRGSGSPKASTRAPETPKIVLIGPMGAGKSTVGDALAGALAVPFVDLDEEIEKGAGMSVTAIFSEYGEEGFRELEEKALRRQLAFLDCRVIAAGGGIVVRAANRNLLDAARRAGSARVVYLHAAPEVLFERVRHCTERPLLQTGNPKERLADIVQKRQDHYQSCADHRVDSSQQTTSHLVTTIKALL